MQLFAERPARAVVPFVAVAVAGLLIALLPPYSGDPANVFVAVAGCGVVVALAVAVIRLPPAHWAVAVPPLAFFVVVALGRHATGGSTSGLAPLVLLPILWIMMYGTRSQLWWAGVATGLVFIAPLLLVGAPSYALGDWRRGVLWFMAVVVVCPSLQRAVHQLRAAVAELAIARDRFERLVDNSPHGVLLLDAIGTVDKVNSAFCRIVGMSAAEMLGSPVRELPFTAGGEPSLLAPLLSGDLTHMNLDRTVRRPDGEIVHVTIAVVGLDGPGRVVESLLVTVVDVSERKRYEKQLARLADHDPLTGLVNRRRLDADLTAHLARCRRYGPTGALLMIDLDHFKQVNDTLGHSAGDELIVSVAAVLRRRMRDSDIVARLGGDEFAILLPYADRADAEVVARDVVQMIRNEVVVLDGTRPHPVTTSVGAVLIDDLDVSPGELLSTADMTMYDAKDAGRDQFVVHDTDLFAVPRSSARIAWARRISSALADDALVVHAQPVLDLHTGEITGAELLVRMVDDTGALIMPGTFLYIAERTDLIIELDLFMIEKAVQVLEQTQRVAPGFSIEVNLSGRSVGNPRVARHLAQLLADHRDVDPHGLVLEITETTAVSNIEVARSFAENIRLLGCRFALDDFGAGFGSFYYLKHLLFDLVKIDGEFVVNCPTNPVDQLIITSIVTIAGGLGKETIAEFVADHHVLEVVRSLGVDHAQGYHIGRPEPVDALIARLDGVTFDRSRTTPEQR
jgi:diguanylate cyclase (GGDEF)-like protein/PAS domain S-box-containing protein